MTPIEFKTYRQYLELTQAELATLFDCGQSTIAAWEAGQNPVPRLEGGLLKLWTKKPKVLKAWREAIKNLT